jgi:hypothetical protein
MIRRLTLYTLGFVLGLAAGPATATSQPPATQLKAAVGSPTQATLLTLCLRVVGDLIATLVAPEASETSCFLSRRRT